MQWKLRKWMNLKETDCISIMLHAGNLSHKHFAYMGIMGIGVFEVWFRYNTQGEKDEQEC